MNGIVIHEKDVEKINRLMLVAKATCTLEGAMDKELSVFFDDLESRYPDLFNETIQEKA